MNVAADDQRNAVRHSVDRFHYPVMLGQPPAGPIGFRFRHDRLPVPDHIGVVLVPVAAGPARGLPGCVHHVGDLPVGHARLEPRLDRMIEVNGARSERRRGAAIVVEQHFEQFAVPQGAVVGSNLGKPLVFSRTRQPVRPVGIRQELRIGQFLNAAGQREHRMIGGEGDHLVGGIVVVEVIVIVLKEEHGRGTKRRSIDRRDLFHAGLEDKILVRGAEDRL